MVMEELSVEEQQIAARTSYVYWAYEQYRWVESTTSVTTVTSSPDDENGEKKNTDTTQEHNDNHHMSTNQEQQQQQQQQQQELLRIRMAMREAYRHYIAQNYHYTHAVQRLKQTIQWRMETQIDVLKLAFSSTTTTTTNSTTTRPTPDQPKDTTTTTTQTTTNRIPMTLSETAQTQLQYYERLIQSDLHIQTMAVRGFDRQHRPIIVRQSRQQPWRSHSSNNHNEYNNHETDASSVDHPILDDMEQSYEWSQLYMAERAMAITELHSRGTCHQISAMLDCTTYQSQQAPPVRVVIRVMVQVLQNHYPERLGRAVVVHAPFWMTVLMKLLYPLMATKTREKLVLMAPISTTSSSSLSSWLPNTVNHLFWKSTAVSVAPVEATSMISDDDPNHPHDHTKSIPLVVPSSSDATIQAIVDADQAMVFMRPDGIFQSPIDVMYQLYHVPFYEIYDFENMGTTKVGAMQQL